jgi:hypothetical protein
MEKARFYTNFAFKILFETLLSIYDIKFVKTSDSKYNISL